MIVLIALFVFLLPVTTIYNRQKSTANSIVIVIKKWTSNTCSPLFPAAKVGQFFACR